jgi:1,4-dihydroxy-2-naphthoyl-CoA synthase
VSTASELGGAAVLPQVLGHFSPLIALDLDDPVLHGPAGSAQAFQISGQLDQTAAREAADLGWVNKVVPDGTLDQGVREWCERILSMSPQALRIAKVSLNFEADQLYPSFTHGIEMLAATYGSPELVEGMSAFLEKRKPDFNRFRK